MKNHFDIHAKDYDAVFTHSLIGKAQRERVYSFLKPFINTPKSLSILEINCGTGEDANYLSSLRHTVLATDVSKKMIETAKKKHPHLTFKQLDSTKLSETKFTKKFDLIFSNFGGLNCLSPKQLNTFINSSVKLVNPGGKLVLVIMPKKCLWERVYFWLKGDRKKATRRNTSKQVLVNVAGVEVPTWYYAPREVQTMAKKNYKTLVLKPVGVAIPPSYLERFFKTKPILFGFIKRLEKAFAFSIWANYADHFLIVLQKKNST